MKARSHSNKGQVADAQKLYQAILQAFPNNKRAQQGLAKLKNLKQKNATYSPPQEVVDQLFKLYYQGQFSAVVEQAQALIEQYQVTFLVWNILGAANIALGRAIEASSAFKKVTELNPNYADGFSNLGLSLQHQEKLDEALEAYNKAISIKPDYAVAYFNMGVTLQHQDKLEEAIETYNKALSINPNYIDAYNNMGNVLKNQGKLEEAIEAYNKALSIKPDCAEAYNNMGNGLKNQGKLDDAIEAYNKALLIKPDYAEAYYNMGITLQDQNKLEEAIEAYNKALLIKPGYESARAQKLHQQANICDWKSIEEDRKLIPQLGTSEKSVEPFSMLSLEDAPERHQIRSQLYAKAKYRQKPLQPTFKGSKKPNRIRIGYFSADFHNHATMYLMAKIFALHDKQKFKIYAYSYGPDKNDKMRQELIRSVDIFNDVREMNDKDVALLARQDNIDIAIDLKGYTQNQRLGIFAYRPARTQISYLGYPGNLGADFIDYIVADPIVAPFNQRHAYSEKIIYLPHTYQPNDNKRIISKNVTTKTDMGLPEEGLVFCCFNNNYKISINEFDIWMRLLGKVDGSVFWLFKSNLWAQQNLRLEAEKRGIKANRLIFAERIPQDEHLARQKHADLFVDTFNYNAHTTISDALWAGLPVVTKLGKGFPARVAGSLLNAVGLPELVTENEHDYEALILELAMNPRKLAIVKDKIAINRLSQPLFDTELYLKHLEDGYQQAYQNYFDGKSPETIIVTK